MVDQVVQFADEEELEPEGLVTALFGEVRRAAVADWFVEDYWDGLFCEQCRLMGGGSRDMRLGRRGG